LSLTIHAFKRRDGLVLALVLFIAALMRFGEAGIVEYFHDDAMLATLVQEFVAGERLPTTGILSSTGIPNPPTSVYALALPFALSPDPVLAIGFVMGLNVIGVGVLFWMAQRYTGRDVALVASLTYAISPWAVLYSRKLWAQDYHTPFILLGVALLLYALFEGREAGKRRAWALALALPLLIFAMQIHFAAWALLPAFGYLLWRGRHNIAPRGLLAGILLSLLTLAPYLIGLAQTLQADPERLSSAAERSEAREGLSLSAQPLSDLWHLATGQRLSEWVAGVDSPRMDSAIPDSTLWSLLGIAALIGAGVGLWGGQRRTLTLGLLLWALLPPLLLVVRWTPVYLHYFVACLPPLAWLSGQGALALVRALPYRAVARPTVLLAYGALLLMQALWWRGALRWLDSTHLPYPAFTTPLHYLLDIREALAGEQDVVVISQGMAWNINHEVGVWETLLKGRADCVRTVRGEGYAVLPEHPFAVLIAPDAPANPVRDLYANADAETLFPERTGGGAYRLRRFAQAPTWNGIPLQALDSATPFANGVTLIGYGLETGEVALEWRLPSGKRGDDWQYSIQAFDSTSERVAQLDSTFWQGIHWCEGDRLITYAPFSLPASASELRISLYRLLPNGGYENALVSETGESFVRLPLAP
jgi:hypothetical protein